MQPSAALCDSYRELVAEFSAAGEKPVPFVLGFDHSNVGEFLDRLEACARGIGLPEGFVAHSTYWLVSDQKHVVGVSNIRHELTPALRHEGGNIGYGIRPSARRQGFASEILRLSLLRAAELGHTRVLITCAKSNVGSSKTILRNGGVLESEEFLADRGEVVQRYWIEIAPRATV